MPTNAVPSQTPHAPSSGSLPAISSKRLLTKEIVDSAEPKGLVGVAGIVTTVRDFKSHAFIKIEDRSGALQTVVDKSVQGIVIPAPGSFVEMGGIVELQPRAPGGKELRVANLRVISSPTEPLPVLLNCSPKENLEVQLDHRPAALRNPWINAVFRMQHLVGKAFRESMENAGCIEVHTSKLVSGGTEGGAQVFALKYFDKQVSLAQSPQVFKQLAVGAFERVYEIGPVFRAENSNTSRHLTEFTSLDFEIAHISSQHDVMDVEEMFVRRLFDTVKTEGARILELHKVTLPEIVQIPRITHQQACSLVEKHKTAHPERTWDFSVGEAVFKEFNSRLVFVYDYPRDEKPFYIMPHKDNPQLTHSFDLLFNGLEMSSGGQRIHELDMLLANMTAYGLNPANYPAYQEAFKYGMPTHGGAGIGLERVTQMLLGLGNVREATMFPRDVKRVSP